MSSSSATVTAEVNARLQRDLSNYQPVIYNVQRREFGESQVAVGLVSLTRSATRRGAALPDEITRNQTAAVYLSDTLQFPRFELQPESKVVKVIETVARLVLRFGNSRKVDFSSHPEFSRRYRVQALDTEGTRWLFDDRVIARLAGTAGLSIAAANGSLLLYRAGTELSGDVLEAFFGEAIEVFRAFEAAARRPSARAALPAETDMELFVKQASALVPGLEVLPAFALADAEAFIQQPPPRTITVSIARYVEARAPLLAGVVGGAFAAAGAVFLLLGWQKWQWFEMIPLFFFLVCGASAATWFIVARLRIRHLLRYGRAGKARIEAIQSSVSRVDGETKFRLELQVEAGGAMHRASCPIPDKAVPRLQAISTEIRMIPVLYSAGNPARVLVADLLVAEQGIS